MIPPLDNSLMNSIVNSVIGATTLWALDKCGFPQMVKVIELQERMAKRRMRQNPRRYVMMKAKASCRGGI